MIGRLEGWKGTRIPVEIIFRKLAENITIDEILADYPRLTREDFQAALAYAAKALGTENTLMLELAHA